MVIPGYGRIGDEHDVLEYRDMLTIIRDRVQAAIEQEDDAGADQGDEAECDLRVRAPLQPGSGLDGGDVRRSDLSTTLQAVRSMRVEISSLHDSLSSCAAALTSAPRLRAPLVRRHLRRGQAGQARRRHRRVQHPESAFVHPDRSQGEGRHEDEVGRRMGRRDAALAGRRRSRFTLEVGDHLIIEGAPPRDSADKKVLVRKVSRPATEKKPAWEWRRQRPVSDASGDHDADRCRL